MENDKFLNWIFNHFGMIFAGLFGVVVLIWLVAIAVSMGVGYIGLHFLQKVW